MKMENSKEIEKNDSILHDLPLSPVLCDNTSNRKLLKSRRMQRKSRINLSNRFSFEMVNNESQSLERDANSITDEESFTASQTEDILEKLETLEKMEAEQECSKQEKFEDFVFKKPSSHNRKINIEPSKYLEFKGFQTAAGTKIQFSEDYIKSVNLFNDILNPLDTSTESTRSNKYSFLSKVKPLKSQENKIYSKNDTKFEKFEGFKTALGNKEVQVLKSLKSTHNKFNEIIDDTTPSSKKLSENKQIKAEEEKFEIDSVLNVAKNIFGEELEDIFNSSFKNSKDISSYNVRSSEFQEFQTASGYSIKYSKKNIKSNLFHDILNPIDKSYGKKIEFANKEQFGGFKTASDKEIKITETLLKTVRSKFNDELQDSKPFFSLTESKCENYGKTTGFKKASGAKVKIDDSILNAAKYVLFGEDFKDTCNSELKNSENIFSSQETDALFKNVSQIEKIITTESNQNVNENLNIEEEFKGFDESDIKLSEKISQTVLAIIQCINIKQNVGSYTAKRRQLSESQNLSNKKRFKHDTNFGAFTSASGNFIKVSKDLLEKANQHFNENNNEFVKSNNIKACDTVSSSTIELKEVTQNKNAVLNRAFQLPSCSSFDLSETLNKTNSESETFTKDKNVNEENATSDQSVSSISSFSPNKLRKRKRLGISTLKPKLIAKDKLERAKLIFEDENQIRSPVRINKEPSVFVSTPLKHGQTEISIDSDLTPIKKINVSDSYPKQSNNLFTDGRILIQECTKGNIDHWTKNLEVEKIKLEKKLKVIVERQSVLNLQKSLLTSDCRDRQKKRSGVLFTNKQNNQKVALQKGLQLSHYLNKDLNITPKNAEMIHFNCPLTSVITKDGATVVPNAQDLIGLSEIEIAFKVMPGVVPKLIPNGWIRNHFKWIVWKLASYERFTTNLKDCLTLENVIQQLKYRYDREIDRAERPTLRKFFEKDDVSQKRMVLCVADIFNLPQNKIELELTDGWYSVRTVIDEPLYEQVIKGKITVGTKLITCGAELLNCDGCYPLEAIDTVRLKISYNSTRRALWYTKLGYQKYVEPFPLKLQFLNPKGGTVGCIKVYVARVYPIKYMEKQKGLTVWRNRKAEEMRAQDWENERLKKIEEVREVVRKDYERNKHSSERHVNINKCDIKSVTCPQTLFNLYTSSNDPESLEEILSSSQKSAIMDYQQNLYIERQQEIKTKIQENVNNLQLSERNVTSVLQLLIIDGLDSKESIARFQIWRPSETQLQMLKENSLFYFFNVFPKKNGDFTSTNRTIFKPIKEVSQKFDKYKRSLLPIVTICNSTEKPVFNEFDTVGIIVQITVNSFSQSLWLADCNQRLLYIQVFEGPKNCLLLDNFKSGQLVAISNLICSVSKFGFGEAVANHSTVISCYPQHKHLKDGLSSFNKEFPNNLSTFLEECNQKINIHIDRLSVFQNSKNYSGDTLAQSSSLSSIFNDSSEESTLVYSRITSTDVALSLIDIDKFV